MKLPQRQLERTHAARDHAIDDELIGAAGGVHFDRSVANDLQPVVQVEAQPGRGAAPHHGAHLGSFVLESEVAVPGVGA